MEQRREDIRNVLVQFRQHIHDEMDARIADIEDQLEHLLATMSDGSVPAPNLRAATQAAHAPLEVVTAASVAHAVSEATETAVAEAEERLGEQINETIAHEMKASRRSVKREFERIRAHIARTNVLWSMLVIFGGWLTWYGAWGIIGTLPVLREPLVALVVGISCLLLTGAVYRKLVG